VSQRPKLSEIVQFLEPRLEGLKAILPELSSKAHARVNAARERCDALVEKAKRESAMLKRDADRATIKRQATELREKARKVLEAAKEEAAVAMLDAQADEYFPLTGELFAYQTLEVLARTSVKMYGGEDAVEHRMHEWRARWWERQAPRGNGFVAAFSVKNFQRKQSSA
jgi:vacuolar-type H+-ATPase subunit H